MNTRKTILTILTTLCALMSMFGVGSTSALASASHVFSKAFGEPCSATPCGPGQLKEPEGVAVNEATGQVYVVDKGDNRVEYYSSEGQYEGQFNGTGEYEVTVAGKLEKKTGGTPAPTGELSTPESIAMDNDPESPSYGDVYVTDVGHSVIDKFNASGEYVYQIKESAAGEPFGRVETEQLRGIAVGSDGELWVGHEGIPGVVKSMIFNFSGAFENKYGSGHVVGGEEPFQLSNSTLAVDSEENLYVCKGSALLKLNSSAEILNEEFVPQNVETAGLAYVELSTGDVYLVRVGVVERFGSEGDQLEAFGGDLTGASSISVNSSASKVYVADSTTDQVDLYVVEKSEPSVEGESFSKIGSHSATVEAGVDTHGLGTNYAVEYGTSETYGSTAHETSLAGSLGGKVAVSVALEGLLQPETTYYFRVTAKNADGTVYGPGLSFTTQSGFTGLPDGRGFELVSPVVSADGDVFLSGNGEGFEADTTQRAMRASAGGGVVEYLADPLASGGNGQVVNGTGNEFVASRGSGGWSTVDLETPGLERGSFEAALPSELLNSGTSIVSAGSHVLSEVGDTRIGSHDIVEFVGARSLVDSVGGRGFPVSVLPAAHPGEPGVPVLDARFGGVGTLFNFETDGESRVISADGSRVFWTDVEEGPDKGHVFVRENDSVTVAVSVGPAVFWTASVDGRYAFYTEKEELWRFDVEDGSRENLAKEGLGGEGAGVQGVIGVNETGEDGSYVYFAATSVLADSENLEKEKARSQACDEGEGHGIGGGHETLCNLYVRHDGVTMFIATVTFDDLYGEGGTGSATAGDLGTSLANRVAEVAPDGGAFVFTSRASLTGYPNNGKREIYVYHADGDGLSCVSCNPTGVTTVPVGNGASAAELVFSRSSVFMHRWISEDGSRVFFQSNEALVAQDTDGTSDVYEWEQDGTGSCESVKSCVYLLSGGSSPEGSQFLDASANGNDVFIITRADLVPEDQGETRELYDVRVGAKEPPAEPVCTGTGCQGLPAGPPLFATPSTATFNGVGNFSPSTVTSTKPKARSKPAKCRKGFHRDKQSSKCIKTKTRRSRSSKSRKSIHGKGSK